MAGNIFLNYRRGDDPGTAGRIFDRLEGEFGKHAVFMDVEGRIKPGDDYVTVLRSQVAACDVVLAVIGPRWLTVTDGDGRRRLDNADDWVRVEIASALEAGDAKRVIPVLVGGASMPRAEELPDDLKELTRKQAVRVTLERFQADTYGVISEVRRVLADLEIAQRAAAKARAEAAARQNKEERRRAQKGRLPNSRALRLMALSLAVVAGVAVAGLSYYSEIAVRLRSEGQAPAETSAPTGPQDFLRSIVVASNGECPEADLVRLPDLGSREHLLKGLGFTYVLQATALRRTSSRVSDWIYSAKPGLFEPVVIYGRDTVSKSLLVSIKDATNVRRCGWLDEDAALFDPDKSLREYAFGPKPIQVKDGPDGRSNPYNTLHLKVVLQNLNRDGQDGAPILTLPGESTRALSLKRLKLFDVFEVFAWKNAPDSDNDRETRTYYLIGRSSEPSVGGRLDGWVHEDDIYVWATRIAAFWAGTGEARGYLRKDLLAGPNYVIVEPAQGSISEPKDRSPPRFPVVAQEPLAAEIIRQRNSTSAKEIDTLITSYRIAIPISPLRPGAKDNYGSISVDVSNEVGKRHGLRPDQLKRIYSRSASVGLFYFQPRTKDGRQIFKFYLAIEAGPLRRLHDSVVSVCTDIDRSDGFWFLKRALFEMVDVAADSQSSVADLLSRRLLIPTLHLNPLLQKPMAQMEHEIRLLVNTEQITHLRKSFCKSARLLGWVLEGKKILTDAQMEWDDVQKSWKQRNDHALLNYQWAHGGGLGGGTGVPLYYVPMEYLPQ